MDTKEGPYLGYCDLYGTTFSDVYAATGLGAHMALPLLRKNYDPNMSREAARAVLEDVMRVLFYRDCRTVNKVCGKCGQ